MADWQSVYRNKTGKPAYSQSSNRFKHDYVGFLEGELDRRIKQENLKPTTNTDMVQCEIYERDAKCYIGRFGGDKKCSNKPCVLTQHHI